MSEEGAIVLAQAAAYEDGFNAARKAVQVLVGKMLAVQPQTDKLEFIVSFTALSVMDFEINRLDPSLPMKKP